MNIKNAYIQFNDGQKVPLTKERVLVGREEGSCDLVINDSSVSRRHAYILFEEGGWFVEDLESRNKTFVNQEAIPPNKRVGVQDGNTLHFGFYAVEFHLGSAGEQVEDPDATVAIDMASMKANDMLAEELKQRKAAPTAPKSYKAPKAAPAEAPAEDPFGYLELHSVTNPKRYSITKEVTAIGTDPSKADITIIDSMAAPRHAEVRFLKGKRVTVRKVGQNPLKVNGRPVGEVPLRDRDEIEIGESKFSFRLKRFPEHVAGEKPASKMVLYAVVAIVLLAVVGGGAYVYKGMLQPKKDQPATTPIAGQPQSVMQDVLDLVVARRYDDALSMISRLRTSDLPDEDKARLQSWTGEIQLLSEAVAFMDRRDMPNAQLRAGRMDRRSSVAQAATRELRNIEVGYNTWLREARRRMEENEQNQKWAEALAALEQLETYDTNAAEEHQLSRKRITAKREAFDVYTRGIAQIETNFRTVGPSVEGMIERLDKIIAETPELAEPLAATRERLADLKAHADLMILYSEYTGERSQLVPFTAMPRRAYEKRPDVDMRLQRMERAGQLTEEARQLTAGLPRDGLVDANAFARMQEIITKYEEILRMDSGENFALGRHAGETLRQLKETRRAEIFRRFSEPVKVDPAFTGLRRRIEESLEERRKWYDIISLFSVDARRFAGDADNLRIAIPDPQLYDLFRSAYSNYENSLSRVAELLTNAAYERDQNVLSQREQYFNRLQSNTFSDDTYGSNRIYNLKNTIDSILGN